MKNLCIVIIFTVIMNDCNAQIFAQKKTRRELMLQQIAALKVYTGYLQKGYSIAKNGINAINDIKNGDFDLHNVLFDSYKKVNPILLNYAKVPAMISLVNEITTLCGNASSMIEKDANLTLEEKKYLQNVTNTLLNKTNVLVNQLTMTTTDELLEMQDKDRISWIDRIYIDIKDINVFVQSFNKSTQLLSAQRLHAQTEINNSKSLNGLR